MLHRYFLGILLLLNAIGGKAQNNIAPYNVSWTSQSLNSSGSMPMGNGDIGANLWVDQNSPKRWILKKA